MKKIDESLNKLGDNIPKVNPYLHTKIYQQALDTDKVKAKSSFFKKHFALTLSSIIVLVAVIAFTSIIGFNRINGPTDQIRPNDSQTPESNPNEPQIPESSLEFYPSLSPSKKNTIYFEYDFSYSTTNYDYITYKVINKVHNQKVFIANNNYEITDIVLNNGDVEIISTNYENKQVYELTFDNTYTNIHYIDFIMPKGFLNKNSKFNFILYIDRIDLTKGFGYDLIITKQEEKGEK